MSLELQPATEADARRSAEIEGVAYASNSFSEILFPGPPPPDAFDGRAKGLVAELHNDATVRWSKVVDTDLPEGEQMIAFSKWHIHAEPPKPTPLREFGPGSNAEACELVFGGTMKQRARLWGDRPHVYMALLHTDPKQQGRGAGRMLVRQVIDEARRLGLVAYLQSSPAGHEMYKRCGFHDIECLSTDLSKWGAMETHCIWAMMCDPSNT
ncbi:acyl-CoA N-acyltransferase [Annulohypoxylon maeteangense]|uniref:acyl-CoA N-acyltransferase n=1 Tax=Annulohypoxylon maeteangense TaxID=1927788 RepID=UPI0020074957|nr:acyl-CoA N-acyltransferase [Annulohypoxylon maeteangense]KAI0890516.1 acyl-CoA N-acyltransferase [Annulohypoxylon maeteangense]